VVLQAVHSVEEGPKQDVQKEWQGRHVWVEEIPYRPAGHSE
jgi:hypothetical protein